MTIAPPSLNREKSTALYEKACEVTPGGVNSPVRAFKGLGGAPLIVERGSGDTIYDLDGNSYLDFCGSWGALIHGHAHPQIVQTVKRQVERGSSFGIATPIETTFAQKLTQLIPSIEQVRFVSSGTEATMSAVRLARGVTGRDKIVKFIGNYHGHADPFLAQAGSGVISLSASSKGVPEAFIRQTICLPYNNIEKVQSLFLSHGDEIAAVIVEPVAANMGVIPPKLGFLQALRKETERCGSLLIFDEVITGFRVALRGAGSLYNIDPDLVCLGKIIGGGFPAAAFGGKKAYMSHLAPEGDVYQAGTLSGNPVAMAAGYQAIALLEKSSTYSKLEELTNIVTEPIRAWIEARDVPICLNQVGSLFTLFFGVDRVDNFDDVKKCDLEMFRTFFHSTLEKGIYLSPSQHEANFVSLAHTQAHLEFTRDVLLETLTELC